MSDTPPPYPPPRNVIYFFRATNLISLAGIANLPYTDVIVGFLIPGSIGLTGDGYASGEGHGKVGLQPRPI